MSYMVTSVMRNGRELDSGIGAAGGKVSRKKICLSTYGSLSSGGSVWREIFDGQGVAPEMSRKDGQKEAAEGEGRRRRFS